MYVDAGDLLGELVQLITKAEKSHSRSASWRSHSADGMAQSETKDLGHWDVRAGDQRSSV